MELCPSTPGRRTLRRTRRGDPRSPSGTPAARSRCRPRPRQPLRVSACTGRSEPGCCDTSSTDHRRAPVLAPTAWKVARSVSFAFTNTRVPRRPLPNTTGSPTTPPSGTDQRSLSWSDVVDADRLLERVEAGPCCREPDLAPPLAPRQQRGGQENRRGNDTAMTLLHRPPPGCGATPLRPGADRRSRPMSAPADRSRSPPTFPSLIAGARPAEEGLDGLISSRPCGASRGLEVDGGFGEGAIEHTVVAATWDGSDVAGPMELSSVRCGRWGKEIVQCGWVLGLSSGWWLPPFWCTRCGPSRPRPTPTR